MDESVEKTYYQENRNVILNRAEDYYKNDKERLKEEEDKNTIRIKRENMEETDTIYLKKRN